MKIYRVWYYFEGCRDVEASTGREAKDIVTALVAGEPEKSQMQKESTFSTILAAQRIPNEEAVAPLQYTKGGVA